MKRILSVFLCGLMLMAVLLVPVSAANEKPQLKKEALLAALYESDITEIKAALDAEVLS